MDTNVPTLSSTLFLDRVGEVVLFLSSCGLSWNPVSLGSDASSCCQMMFHLDDDTEIRFSDVYAVEFTGLGLINIPGSSGGSILLSSNTQMHRFVLHGFQRGKNNTALFTLSSYTFGHMDLQACQAWFDQINACIKIQEGRPKNLLVFVHPRCGKGNGCKTWDTVAPLFSRAKVTTKVTVTERAGHAYDVLKSSTDRELRLFDGIIAVGGDGLFNEVLNGLLSSRHKVPYPPAPTKLDITDNKGELQKYIGKGDNDDRNTFKGLSDVFLEASQKGDDYEPLLSASESIRLATREQESCFTVQIRTLHLTSPTIGLDLELFLLGRLMPLSSAQLAHGILLHQLYTLFLGERSL